MEIESIGKLLPRLILPHAQDWAQRTGQTFLSKLLVDDQFRMLVERFGAQLESRARSATEQTRSGKRKKAQKNSSSADCESQHQDLKATQERLAALEEQCELQQAIFETVRKKIRPLALALGSCTECLVGVELCTKCAGRGKVGAYKPDCALLSEEIIAPLAAQGTPIILQVKKRTQSARRTPATNGKENGHVGSLNGQHRVGE
jgi:hypothetical protein